MSTVCNTFSTFFLLALVTTSSPRRTRSGIVCVRQDTNAAARLTLLCLVPKRLDSRLLVYHFQRGIWWTAYSIVGIANHERTILIWVIGYKPHFAREYRQSTFNIAPNKCVNVFLLFTSHPFVTLLANHVLRIFHLYIVRVAYHPTGLSNAPRFFV